MDERIICVFLGLLFGGAGAWFMIRYGIALGIVDFPKGRSSHCTPTPSGGGVGLLLTFILVSVFLAGAQLNLWLSATFLALVSLFDDRLELSPSLRLLFQFGAAAAVVLSSAYQDFSILNLTLIPFWLLFIVSSANFYNFMDGINGIAGITGLVGFAFTATFALMAGEEKNWFFLSLAMSAACAGFLPFNLPKARVFMGDVGSILLGFVFAEITFSLSRDLGSFLCLLVFIMPFYADALSTLFVRWRDGEKLSQAHRRHLYQILANEHAFPHWLVSCWYCLMQMVVGIAMLWAWTISLWYQFLVLFLFCILFSWLTWMVRKNMPTVKKLIPTNYGGNQG